VLLTNVVGLLTWIKGRVSVLSYDFVALNDKEFEALATDILSVDLGVRVERFKPGKDLGVDGRWFSSDGGETIVQCKHWVKTGFRGLLNEVKAEKIKVEALAPLRYILVTSVPLSRINKNALSVALAPHVLSPSDIWGPEDLNDALGRHPTIERRHYKLWLSSSNALSLLLNNAIHGRSRAEIELMQREAPMYVATEDHTRAQQHLNTRRVLIVTGAPGVGKTTLARQLVLEHVAEGHQLVSIEENISEAEGVYDNDAKQVFYFDDFLGRTFLESLRPKQDSHLTNFMARVARDPSKRFVLTSRTNILNRGVELSDLLSGPKIQRQTYELDIGRWSSMDRARILYNHIWYSNLSVEYINEIYHEKRYHAVINHPNFNPRLIAFTLDSDKVGAVPPDQYWNYVVTTLNDPRDIWRHFFDNQLTQDCRDLVFLTVINGRNIDENELRTAFTAIDSKRASNLGQTYHDFSVAVRLATGSVLNRSLGAWPSARYTLFNPSIADYVLRYLSEANLWQHYFVALRTRSSLLYLTQLKKEPFFGYKACSDVLRALASRERLAEKDEYSLLLARILVEDDDLSIDFVDLVEAWIELPNDAVVMSETYEYLWLVAAWLESAAPEKIVRHLPGIVDVLEGCQIPIDDEELLSPLLEAARATELSGVYEAFRNMIVRQWEESVSEYVGESGILDEYFSEDDDEIARDSLEDVIRSKLSDSGIQLTQSELDSICDEVDILDVIGDNISRISRSGHRSPDLMRMDAADLGSAAAIDDLFDRSGVSGR
jgi:hypothetical protein